MILWFPLQRLARSARGEEHESKRDRRYTSPSGSNDRESRSDHASCDHRHLRVTSLGDVYCDDCSADLTD
jgi:hypothetical protein